jgi:hypothetical protein
MAIKSRIAGRSPLPRGEAGAKRWVRGYGLSIGCNPSPQPSPNGRGGDPVGISWAGDKPRCPNEQAAARVSPNRTTAAIGRSSIAGRSPLPGGEVGAQRRVRGYGLSIGCNPSPQPSPNGRGGDPVGVSWVGPEPLTARAAITASSRTAARPSRDPIACRLALRRAARPIGPGSGAGATNGARRSNQRAAAA